MQKVGIKLEQFVIFEFAMVTAKVLLNATSSNNLTPTGQHMQIISFRFHIVYACRNKTVCEDHFVDSCFMNYKKERLVKTAVPTLNAARDGTVFECKLDELALSELVYDFNDKGKSIDLPDAKPVQRLNKSTAVKGEYVDAIESPVDDSSHNSPSVRRDSNIAEPIVLNSACPRSQPKRYAVKNVQEKAIVAVVQKGRSNGNDSVEPLMKRSRRVERDELDSVSLVSAKTYNKSNTANTFMLHDSTLDESYDDVPLASSNTKHTNNETTDGENSASVHDNTMYMQMMAEQMKQIEELKQIIADKMTTPPKVHTHNGHASTAATSTQSQPIRVEKCPPMTKVQLFNGIRKYLNPSMVALLRMEMFGSSDREYRVDEKQFAKELYGLNESVYDFMRDEWRFRLPPKSDVENWIKSPDEDETWELC